MSDSATPMMSQYRRVKGEVSPDTIVFFRLGDFYEMFFEDAKEAAQLLDITLTRRQNAPMCGVPHHAVDFYLAKLIKAGKKVAICEQMEDPALAKGIVRREITRVVTPGTVLEDQVLDSNRNNYLAGLNFSGAVFGLALLDLSTGTFWVEESADTGTLRDNLARYAPAECIVPAEQRDDPRLRSVLGEGCRLVTPAEDWTFEPATAADLLTRHFQVHSLAGFGGDGLSAAVGAAGAVLHYVTRELRREAGHIRRLTRRNPADFMLLDEATIANLDLVAARGPARGGVTATLLGVLDTTRTAMGGRLLRDWLLRPLTNRDTITLRHNAVEHLFKNRGRLAGLREALAEIKDLERLVARLGGGTGNARDLQALGVSLAGLPRLKEQLQGVPAGRLAELDDAVRPLPELAALIARALVDEPPLPLKEGGLIRPGYHAELDELRQAATQGRQWLAEFQAREQERTGIKSLKVRHNQVFGYYIEITRANLGQVPPDYVRKQTMVNAERFITPQLKEYENKILGAQERAMALEYELFLDLRAAAVKETPAVQQTAQAIAELDALSTLAERALTLNYTRPAVHNGDRLHIIAGRHPVIEQMPEAERFVANDTRLDNDRNQIMIITGPNMAGKSTYIRQVALIVIMAQMGSFVPAEAAEVGIVDRVFTRVGASDDIARGRSTFMVEMQETANILNNATARSLIVLDEIGRGTSTFDGISIAWAVAEYLHNNPAVKAKTLFATHYHELTDLALTMPGIQNYNVLVSEKNDRIAFLRRIVPGAADKSYGIQVARLAGLPPDVIARAKEILGNLEESEFGESGQPTIARRKERKERVDPGQLHLFDM